jgi:hypothetical protein
MKTTTFVLTVAGAALALVCTTTPQLESIDVTGVAAEADRARAIDALAHQCPRGNPDCSPANAPPLPRATGPLPLGAAGFELAMTENEAKVHCHSANQTWTVDSREMVACSGSAGASLPFDVSLQLCDASVCRIVLSQYVADAAQAVHRWRDAELDLERKYGAPGARDVVLSTGCDAHADLGACLANGRARVDAAWVWAGGTAVSATLIAPSAQHVFLFVVYSSPAIGRAVHARGL